MSLIIWLIIGGVAGMLAGRVMGKTPPYGLVGDVLLGIAGSVVGGFLLGILGFSGGGGLIGSFITAFGGACVVLWAIRAIKK